MKQCLALLLLPVALFAASVDDLTFTLNDDGASYSVTDCSGSATGEMIIPSTYNGLPVTSIGYGAFNSCSSLTSITIPNSVTSIGERAFYRCTSLSSITIPDSVTSIGRNTFAYCSNLTSITIPDSVTSIGESAYAGCSSLAYVTIGDSVTSIGKRTFSGTNISYNYTADNVYYLISRSGQNAYLIDGASASGSVSIPTQVNTAYVKLISSSAFSEATSLTSITIPDSVTSIGNGAFSSCTSLTSVSIPDSVTSIGYGAFNSCSSLTSITIPEGVRYIGGNAFSSCTSLTSVSIPDSVTSIGYAPILYNAKSLASITLPIQLSGLDLFGDNEIPNQDIIYSFTYGLISNGLIKNSDFIDDIAEELQKDDDFIAKLAEAMIAAENNSGLATKEDLPIAVQQGVNQVIAAPSSYNLATTAEVTQARTDGRQDVIDNSADYNLYNESSIMEMNISNPTLSMLNESEQAQVEFTLETSTDLEDWNIEERIQRTVQATGDKFFVRIKSGTPYVTPTVVTFNHPTYGEILTDQDGNVLYGFSIDSVGGDPLYSGSAWPLASHSTDPEPDADVTAALTRGTFSNTSGGPWLKINDRPVYTYAGDSEPNQASGHGLGSVWFTIKPDGTLNQ